MMRGALIIVITLTQQSSPVCIAMIFFFLWRGGEDSRVLHILLRLSGPPDCLESYLIQPDRVYLVFFSAHFFIFFLFLYKRERERESLKQSNMQIYNEMIISPYFLVDGLGRQGSFCFSNTWDGSNGRRKKNPGPVYILRPFNQKKGEKIELGDLTTTHHIICNGAGDYVI